MGDDYMTETIDTSALDITVTERAGNMYAVSGKDAPTLYEKIRSTPSVGNSLELGEMKDNAFTFKLKKAVETAISAKAATG